MLIQKYYWYMPAEGDTPRFTGRRSSFVRARLLPLLVGSVLATVAGWFAGYSFLGGFIAGLIGFFVGAVVMLLLTTRTRIGRRSRVWAWRLACGNHPRAVRVAVLVFGLTAFLALASVWVFTNPHRMAAAIACSTILVAVLGYAGAKCATPDGHLRKTLFAGVSFLAGIQGNYIASATLGGADAAAMDRSIIAPIVHRLDELLNRTARLETAIDEVIAAQLEQLREKDAEIGVLRSDSAALREQLRAAVTRLADAERAAGRNPRAKVEELGRSDPVQLLEFLDEQIESDSADLVEKHRERAAVATLMGKFAEAEASLRIIAAHNPGSLYAENEFGRIALALGDIARAESHFLVVLDRSPNRDTVGAALGNLGLIEWTRGNPEQAEGYFVRALAIHEELGRDEGVMVHLGNLGLVEQQRGDLEKAEDYHTRSLKIAQTLGSKAAMAIQLGNLSVVEYRRWNTDAAEDFAKEALAINRELGNRVGVASALGNLGQIEQLRRNFDDADDYHNRSLQLMTDLGNRHGMATQLYNLGVSEVMRGGPENIAQACDYWDRSIKLYVELGMVPMAETVRTMRATLEPPSEG